MVPAPEKKKHAVGRREAKVLPRCRICASGEEGSPGYFGGVEEVEVVQVD